MKPNGEEDEYSSGRGHPPRVLVGVTGGIAAYKVCEIVSSLAKTGVEVQAILTEAACEFVSPLTFATLSRRPAYTDKDFWQPMQGRPLHIRLGEWAEVFLVAPLTANTLAKLTYGFADNLLTNTVLASTCPILLAPAMNTDMWEQPSVQQNWYKFVENQRIHTVGMEFGLLACDRIGAGRMAEPEAIVAHIESLLYTQGKRDLSGRRVLISAGGTREHFDPVRFLGNPSSGKMGVALAQAALHRGASVTLVHTPLSVSLPPGVEAISVVSANQMQEAILESFSEADFIVMAAAVADVKPAESVSQKLPKKLLPDALTLTPVPDIAAQLGRLKQAHQCLIGFAAQTGDFVKPARAKLYEKKLDAIAANPIDRPDSGFGSDTNQAVFLDRTGRQQNVPACSKLKMAHELWDFVLPLLECEIRSAE